MSGVWFLNTLTLLSIHWGEAGLNLWKDAVHTFVSFRGLWVRMNLHCLSKRDSLVSQRTKIMMHSNSFCTHNVKNVRKRNCISSACQPVYCILSAALLFIGHSSLRICHYLNCLVQNNVFCALSISSCSQFAVNFHWFQNQFHCLCCSACSILVFPFFYMCFHRSDSACSLNLHFLDTYSTALEYYMICFQCYMSI